MKNKMFKYGAVVVPVLGLAFAAAPAFAAGESLGDVTDIAGLGTTTLTSIGTAGYLVLAGVAVIIGGLVIWKFAVKHVKKSVK